MFVKIIRHTASNLFQVRLLFVTAEEAIVGIHFCVLIAIVQLYND